jgi:hypothetical protein
VDSCLVVLGVDIRFHVEPLFDAFRSESVARPVVADYCRLGVRYALAAADAAVSATTASTRIRFLLFVACSNRTLPVVVANTV